MIEELSGADGLLILGFHLASGERVACPNGRGRIVAGDSLEIVPRWSDRSFPVYRVALSDIDSLRLETADLPKSVVVAGFVGSAMIITFHIARELSEESGGDSRPEPDPVPLFAY